MDNCRQTNKQDVEKINDDDFFDQIQDKKQELFKRALSEAIDMKVREIEKETENMEMPALSRRHKIRMNRLFRERVGNYFLPFPEEDNLYERLRSRLRIKLKINEALDRRKERRRERKTKEHK